MPPGDLTGQIEGVRQQSVAVLDDLIARADEFELADPPPALDKYRQALRENTYRVLVVGEAKRGKSTFVNALIGRDVLPTDVDVATSQVFNIRPSEREAYRLRFEDGSEREITAEDLPLYGSEIIPEAEATPTANEMIRWIEVEMPVRFLPNGVSILDTPGLGALYAGHARITHRFVPEADAVIFVLESGQPAVEEDLKFIEQILTVTNNIFFVQTKIDQYAKEDWQSIQRRNQEILKERFKDQLADTNVWPISSTNLQKAASADKKTEEAYLMVSRHKELMDALQAFLARVSGWGRATEAMAVTLEYHTTNRKGLAGRLAGLNTESKQQQAELQKIAVEGKRRFDAEWGIQGEKYRALRERLQRTIAVGKQSFSNTLQPGSDIELAQKAKIDEIQKLKQASQVSEEMPGDIITASMNEWARICKEVQERCLMLLGPFIEAAESVGAPLDPGVVGLTTSTSDEKFKRDYFSAFRSAAGGGMMALGVTGMASLLMPGIMAAAVASAAMPFVAIPVLATLVGGGLKGAFGGQVKAAQQQVRIQLAEQMQKVRRHFFDVRLAAGSFSRVDEHFMTLDRVVNEHVRALVEKKSKESQAEISRLKEAMQMDDRQRQILNSKTQQQLAKWDEIGKSVQAVANRIQTLQKPATPPTGT
ncbi:isoniazid-induced dynamin-like GTPase IniA [soil metagenome]